MEWKAANLKTRLYIVTATILVVGVTTAILIYFTVGEIDTENIFSNQLDESKSYQRSLELYGGKANLLASQFMQWFNGLWHGKSLGITLGWITGIVCCLLFLFAYNLPSDSE